ncbi:MAG: SIS domain-containing protein [Methanofastidiosum sp.]
MKEQFNEHNQIFQQMQNDTYLHTLISQVVDLLIYTFKNGNKVLICGNGGSAADSQHFATELVSRFRTERKALNAEALTTDTSCITAISNDYSFNRIFSRQVQAKGKEGDVLIGITTSGNSKNIVKAFKQARSQDMITVAMTGNFENMKCEKYADYVLKIPSQDTARIQEATSFIYHVICEYVEAEFNV